MDYSRLFQAEPAKGSTDLVLLSVSNTKEKIIELVDATERMFAPKWILLLSDDPVLPHFVAEMPSVLAGFLARSSSPELLQAAVRLILAGGKCFQSAMLPPKTPSLHASAATPLAGNSSVAASTGDGIPRRRWYDRNLPPPMDALPSDAAQERRALLTKVVEGEADPPPHVDEQSSPRQSRVASEAAMLKLTPRQYEVLVLLARGYPMKTVSRQLNISVATAKTHTVTLYQRLQVHTRNAAVYAAFSRGATLGWQKSDSAKNLRSGALHATH